MGSKNIRFISLDLLRGIAAIGVVLYHTLHYSLDIFSPLYILVDLFFVLSVFVLEPIFPSQASDPDAIKAFIKKRALRFWPMTTVALLTWSIWIYAQTNNGNITFDKYGGKPALSFLGALLLLQIFSATSVMWIAPLWSLSAEWFSNLIAIPILLRKSIKLDALTVALGLMLIGVGLRLDQQFISDFGPIKGWEALGRALTGLFIGIILRKNFARLSLNRIFNHTSFSVVSLIALYLFIIQFGYFSVLVAPFLFAPVIVRLALANERVFNSRLKPGAVIAGNLSFGIYVWHVAFCDFFIGIFGKFGLDPRVDISSAVLLFIFTLSCAIIATLITQKFVEVPIQKWFKNRTEKLDSKTI